MHMTKKSYKSLHYYLNKRFNKPKFCQKCGKEKRLDWAKISDTYTRKQENYLALCRSCHFKMDSIGYESILIKCGWCDNKVKVKPYGLRHKINHYCSRDCYWKHKKETTKGKNNSNYRHGRYCYGTI
jgi:transcription elongation factor Elf1